MGNLNERALEESVRDMTESAAAILRSSSSEESRRGAAWLLTVGVRYLQSQDHSVDLKVFDLYLQHGVDRVEMILPRRQPLSAGYRNHTVASEVQ